MKNKEVEHILIEEYVYEKVKKNDVIINIPQEPIYFQEYNHRVIFGLFPQFATWGDNSVWEIQIIRISSDKIIKTFIRTSPRELSDMVSRFNVKNKSEEDYLRDTVVRYLKDYFNNDRVQKKHFLDKYLSFKDKIENEFNLL